MQSIPNMHAVPALARLLLPRSPPLSVQPLLRHRTASRVSTRRHCLLLPSACEPDGSRPGIHNGRSASATLGLPGAAAITLFGVRHTEEDADIGEHILHQRPAAVVVETAITAGHGTATGAMFQPDDQGTAQELQRDLGARIIVQLGRRLRDAAEPCCDPIWQVLTSAAWRQ